MDYKEHLIKLLESFRKEGMLHWKQMLAVEVASAVLAEVLIQNNVVIDCESECIQWPFGIVSKPPGNTQNKKGKATSKNVKSGKSGMIFGIIVNDIQEQDSKKLKSAQPKAVASSVADNDVVISKPSTSKGNNSQNARPGTPIDIDSDEDIEQSEARDDSESSNSTHVGFLSDKLKVSLY